MGFFRQTLSREPQEESQNIEFAAFPSIHTSSLNDRTFAAQRMFACSATIVRNCLMVTKHFEVGRSPTAEA
jgi:hypothetical protein